MEIRNTHVGKTIEERVGYQRYLQGIDTEPTLDESLKFRNSAKAGEELIEPTSTSPRPVSLHSKISEHLVGNWLSWLFGVVVLSIGYLLYDSKVGISRLDTDLQGKTKTMELLGTDLRDAEKNLNAQALQINENKLRIEFLERDVYKKK